MRAWKLALGYSLGAYIFDVVLRPREVAKKARAAAQARGKPLLNIGCGMPSSSVRVAVLGPTGWGDVNCDLAAKASCSLDRKESCHCDITALPFKDKEFGAVIASHVIEHVDDPAASLSELHRVADEVFVITPPWWAPHTWLHPGHQWYRRADGTFISLWRRR